MKAKIIPLDSFSPEPSHKILLDTNILINLFYPTNFESVSDKYATLYKKLLTQKSQLLISSVQVSEFINKCIRIQFNLYKEQIGRPSLNFKKDYRSTDEYRNEMNAILDIIKTDILEHFIFIDDGFSKMQFEHIFLYGVSYDFNDALLAEITQQQGAILITNDADFFSYKKNFKIVTSNKFLLMSH